MYKTTIYCDNNEYCIETNDKVNAYSLKDVIYIQNEEGEEIFAINKDKLIAIDLNTKEESETIIDEDELIDWIANQTEITMYTDKVAFIENILTLKEKYLESRGLIEKVD